jgi:hypothetical protein
MQESCIGCKAGPGRAGQKAIRERLIASETAEQRLGGEQNPSSQAPFRFGSAYGRQLLQDATRMGCLGTISLMEAEASREPVAE